MKKGHFVMKRKLLFLFAAAIGISMFAQEQQSYEEFEYTNGIPTQDHFFVRNGYNDMGIYNTYDDVVSFKSGDLQLVWVYLDDDAVYENEAIQSLTPSEYQAGKPYNEITYNMFQAVIYLPEGIEITSFEDEHGNLFDWRQGERIPGGAEISLNQNKTVEIDGLSYKAYTVICYNWDYYCTHFSSKTPEEYEANGALRKDHSLFGIYMENKMTEAQGRVADMIIARTFLTLKETRDVFFYGTGGNGVENRKMYFHRVALYGSQGFSDLATAISLNKTTAVLTLGNTLQLTATILPINAANKTVNWTSSDSSIATVDNNGLVTAVATGTATITATTTDGSNLSASCEVIVHAERGDLNCDGKVNMDDLTELINYLLTSDATGIDLSGADCDLNGSVGMDDLTTLINFLLTNQWPPEPGNQPGVQTIN